MKGDTPIFDFYDFGESSFNTPSWILYFEKTPKKNWWGVEGRRNFAKTSKTCFKNWLGGGGVKRALYFLIRDFFRLIGQFQEISSLNVHFGALTICLYYPLLLGLKNDGFFRFYVTTLGPNLGCENPYLWRKKSPNYKKKWPFWFPRINFWRGFSIFSQNRDALRPPPRHFCKGFSWNTKFRGGIGGGNPHLRFLWFRGIPLQYLPLNFVFQENA